MDEHNHRHFSDPGTLAAIATSTLIATPYILPFLGIGSLDKINTITHAIGGHSAVDALTGIPSSYGTGIAGFIQSSLAHTPFIGSALTSLAPITIPGIGVSIASGALVSFGAVAVIGIGGALLANWLERRESSSQKFRASTVIRNVALTTSVLIALPSILSGLSLAIAFLAFSMGGYAVANHTILGLQATLGATAMAHGAAGGVLAATLPHLITCGGILLPLLSSFSLLKNRPTQRTATTDTTIELVGASKAVAGQPMELAFLLKDRASGKPLCADDIAVTHTKKLHTMVVDYSLNDYHHLHPVYNKDTGLFHVRFTPNASQAYHVWHDFTRVTANTPTQLRNEIAGSQAFTIPPVITHRLQSDNGDVHAEISLDHPLQSGKSSMATITLRDRNGTVLKDLEPIMGAYGHLAGFSKDGQHFIHCHPLGIEPTNESDKNKGFLQFHVTPEHAGATKFFLQIRQNGREITLPFGQLIQTPERAAERVLRHAHHNQHAMA